MRIGSPRNQTGDIAVPFQDGIIARIPTSELAKKIDTPIETKMQTICKWQPTLTCILQFNCKSLKAVAKRKSFNVQLKQHEITIAAFQETWTNKSGIYLSPYKDYAIAAQTPLQNQSMGLETWISLKTPVARCGDVNKCFSMNEIKVIHDSPRVLIVFVRNAAVSLQIVNAHAHHSKDLDKADKWWDEFCEIWKRKIHPDIATIVLMDANATPDTHATSGVGDYNTRPYTNKSNQCGPKLASFLKMTKYNAPLTFEHLADSSLRQGSFLAAKSDTPILIDCIALSSDVVPQNGSAGQPIWDTMAKAHGHFPLKILVRMACKPSRQASRRRMATYARCNVGKTAQDKKFQELIVAIPPIPEFVEPTSHYFMLAEWIRTAAESAYPQRPSKPKKPFTTDETIECIKRRNKATHTRAWYAKLIRSAPIRAVFKFWSGKWARLSWSVVSSFVRQGISKKLVAAHKQFRQLYHEVQKSVQNDRTKWLENQALELENAVNLGDVRVLQSFISDAKPKTCRPQTAIERDDGTICVDESQCQEEFAIHFAKTLAGKRTSFSHIIEQVWDDGLQALQYRNVATRNPYHLNTKLALTEAFRRLRPKAIAEDCLGPELFKTAASQLAPKYQTLDFKIKASCWVPAQLRGGHLFALYKRKGPINKTGNYRDVVISDVLAKVNGSCTRRQVLPFATTGLHETQLGSGLNGGAVDVAHLLLRAFADACHESNMSCAIAFLDLASAFASVVRRLAMHISITDQELMDRLSRLGFNVNERVDILSELQTLNIWDSSQTPSDLTNIIKQYLSHT